MCGICGFLGPPDPALLRSMTWDLRRRGPDGVGLYEDAAASLGHRRLSIIDLASGDQPMRSASGRRVLAYNGELYNYRELRRDLETRGLVFRTNSDTEVLLEALETWGLDALPRLEGIFAFASWEPAERRLLLARDAFGVKPLRYRRQGERLWFASETRALFRTPGATREVRPEALCNLLRLRYEPWGEVFAGVEEVPPGHALLLEPDRERLVRHYQPPTGRCWRGPLRDAARFAARLDAAVSRQLVADVPVGLFLSGGLDSTALLDAASRAGVRLKTFTIGFGSVLDELDLAARTAARYGAEHHGVVLSPRELVERLPEVFASFDEPVLDAVQVAVWLLAREAATRVKVVLTGEGADEILGGYIHHRVLGWGGLARSLLPNAAFPALGAGLERLPLGLLECCFRYPASLGPSGQAKAAGLVRALPRPALAYLEAATLFQARELSELLTPSFGTATAGEPLLARLEQLFVQAGGGSKAPARVDLHTWLPHNVLNRLDRLTMVHGLEGRVPYLDRELVAEALASPFAGPPAPEKLPLRLAMRGRVADEVRRRSKQGFYLPLDEAAGSELDQLLAEVLDPSRVRERGVFRTEAVKRLRDEGLGRGLLESKRLFTVFALELWMRQVVDRGPEVVPEHVLSTGRAEHHQLGS